MTFDHGVPVPPIPTWLRPSRPAYARAVKANLWIAIPLLVISIFRIGFNPWLLPVVIVVVIVVFVCVQLYFRNTRVTFSEGEYRVTSMTGANRTFRAADAGTLVTVTALISGSTAPTMPQLILTKPDGTKLLRLRGQTWEVEQFTELAVDLIEHGVPNDAIQAPITTAQLRERYPRLIGWWEAHPIAFGLILGFGILAVVIVVAVFAVTLAG